MKYSLVDHCLLSCVHHSPICSSSWPSPLSAFLAYFARDAAAIQTVTFGGGKTDSVIKILLMGQILAVISAFAVLTSASVDVGLIVNQHKVNSIIWGNTFEKERGFLIQKSMCSV